MFNVYFDSGTSNTRGYLFRDYDMIAARQTPIGSKDVSRAGSGHILTQALKEMYDGLLLDVAVTNDQIRGIYASGTISGPHGIYEVEHLPLPLEARSLHHNVFYFHEPQCFNRTIGLIPGIKTIPQGAAVDIYQMDRIGNLRGEETEVAGILSSSKYDNKNIVAILPGSHTQVIYVKHGVLSDILATFTGELMYALSNSTVLSGSIQLDAKPYEELVQLGYNWNRTYGFARALYMIHASKVFECCDNIGRASLLNGIVTGSVTDILLQKLACDWNDTQHIVVAGKGAYIDTYEYLLRGKTNLTVDVLRSNRESLAVSGFKQILKWEMEE
jgi:2-dehydro-3-deoxygalactonokinase